LNFADILSAGKQTLTIGDINEHLGIFTGLQHIACYAELESRVLATVGMTN